MSSLDAPSILPNFDGICTVIDSLRLHLWFKPRETCGNSIRAELIYEWDVVRHDLGD